MNRLTAHIATVQARVDTLDEAAHRKLEADLDVSPEEHFAWQVEQARAHASGQLSAEEAMVVYRALGEVGTPSNGGWSAGTGLATKVSVTLLVGELLRARLGVSA